jgi:DNA-binding CsgD family transcriptional regulator
VHHGPVDVLDLDLPRWRRQQLAWQRRRILGLAASGRDLTVPPEELLDALGSAVGFDAWCAGALDPVTLLPTRSWGNALPPGRAIDLDVRARHAFTMRRLAAADPPVGLLSDAAGDPAGPEVAPQFRRLLAANGLTHCLRAALVCDGEAWGFLHLLRRAGRPDFDAAEVAFVAGLVPHLAAALRDWMLAAPDPGAAPAGPGVLVLDAANQVESVSADAEAWLAQFTEFRSPGPTQPLPAVVYAVACAARAPAELHAPPAHGRLRLAGGSWLHVRATRLRGRAGGDGSQVAVVLEPARPEQVAPVIARAAGLSPREREVAMLVLQGRSTTEIAQRLFISPWTVQDHVTAIFDKVGVRNRRDLAGEVFGIGRA